MIEPTYYDIALDDWVYDDRIIEYINKWELYAYPWTEIRYVPWDRNILEEVSD